MIYFIELWNPTKKWLALSEEDRANYVQNVSKSIAALKEQGAEIITWSVNKKETSKRSPYDYFAIWKFPTQELADYFQQGIDNAGWYEYFDQVNIQGEQGTAEHGMKELISLNVLESQV